MTPRRILVSVAVLALAGRPSDAAGQTLEARPRETRARLGDLVTLEITARLPAGMELIDQVPHPLVQPPRGIRLVSADTLRSHGDGILRGTARMAFYRLGQQPIPTLALLYRKAPGEPPDTLLHMPVSVEITALLPAGNPPLKDIKPLRAVGAPFWTPLAGLFALAAAGFWYLRRRTRLGGSAARRLGDTVMPPGPFDLALARLDDIERAARASGNGVVPLYSDAADVVRHLLLGLGAIPHHGLTTQELTRLLPEALAEDGRRDRCETILRDADLVKFANVRPDLMTALGQIEQARALLEAWRATVEPPSRRAAEPSSRAAEPSSRAAE